MNPWWFPIGIAVFCLAAVYFAIGRNAFNAVHHPEQHEHVPGEWQ